MLYSYFVASCRATVSCWRYWSDGQSRFIPNLLLLGHGSWLPWVQKLVSKRGGGGGGHRGRAGWESLRDTEQGKSAEILRVIYIERQVQPCRTRDKFNITLHPLHCQPRNGARVRPHPTELKLQYIQQIHLPAVCGNSNPKPSKLNSNFKSVILLNL